MNALNNGTGGFFIGGLQWLGFLGGFMVAMIVFITRPKKPCGVDEHLRHPRRHGHRCHVAGGFEMTAYKGIALQAVFGTMAITGTMYVMYASRILRPTPRLQQDRVRLGHEHHVPLHHLLRASTVHALRCAFPPLVRAIGIGVTAFILVVAALTLISDFGFIESGSRYGAPKNMEWYAAFGILISVVWIYIETLRLLSKLNAYRE